MFSIFQYKVVYDYIIYISYYILSYMGKKLRQERRKTETNKDMTEVRQKKRIRENKNREGKNWKKERNTNIIKQIHIETEEKGREKGITKKGVNRLKTKQSALICVQWFK